MGERGELLVSFICERQFCVKVSVLDRGALPHRVSRHRCSLMGECGAGSL